MRLLITPVTASFEVSASTVIFFLISVVFVEIFVSLLCGFSGIIIGHKFNKSKGGLSFLFGFITYIASQLVVLASIFVVGLFDENIMNVFTTNQLTNVNSFKTLSVIVLCIYIAIAIVINIINVINLMNTMKSLKI